MKNTNTVNSLREKLRQINWFEKPPAATVFISLYIGLFGQESGLNVPIIAFKNTKTKKLNPSKTMYVIQTDGNPTCTNSVLGNDKFVLL